MTERYSILQKKLQELESELHHHVSIPDKNPIPEDVLEAFQNRFLFVKNLLRAEIKSHPSNPRYLHHIAGRLAELERDFEVWDGDKTSAMNRDDNASTCACTESCLNDDGEASVELGSPVYEDEPERLSQGDLVEEKALVEFCARPKQENLLQKEVLDSNLYEEKAKEEVSVGFERNVKGEQRRVGIGSLCGAMASGLVLGMALTGYAMGRLSGCFQYVEPGSFLTPT